MTDWLVFSPSASLCKNPYLTRLLHHHYPRLKFIMTWHCWTSLLQPREMYGRRQYTVCGHSCITTSWHITQTEPQRSIMSWRWQMFWAISVLKHVEVWKSVFWICYVVHGRERCGFWRMMAGLLIRCCLLCTANSFFLFFGFLFSFHLTASFSVISISFYSRYTSLRLGSEGSIPQP